jgi:hypothetical protein
MIAWTMLAAVLQAAAVPPKVETVPSDPVACVAQNVVTHPVDRLTVRVPATATYAGHERFNLYGIADAEVHVFVDADAAKKVQRLYWVQFESYLPSNKHRYNYAEGNTRYDLWGTPTWVVASPQQTTTPGRPGSDRDGVMRILARGGYTVPAEVQNVRLVQILDDPAGTGRGRKELMLIYSEDLATTGKTYSELVAKDELTPAFEPLEKPLIDRAIAAFSVEQR